MDIEYEKNEKENAIAIKKKELDVSLRIREVDLQIEEEKKKIDLMEIRKQNAVKEGAFEGEAQGQAVRAFMDSLPKDFSIDQKMALWMELRGLDKSAMIYSKVSSIEMYPPHTDLKKFEIKVEQDSKDYVMDKNKFMLPAILGYGNQSFNDDVSSMNGQSSSAPKNSKK